MKDLEPQPGGSGNNEEFFEILRGLPPEAQEFLTGLSSQFMEQDVYERLRTHPKRIRGLARELKRMGLGDDRIPQVMDYFHLPYTKK